MLDPHNGAAHDERSHQARHKGAAQASIDPGTTVAGSVARRSAVLAADGGSIVIGRQPLPPERHDEIWAVQKEPDFPTHVFGEPRQSTEPTREQVVRPILTIPGIGNSGPQHWQSLWEAEHPQVRRVQQADWDRPDFQRWASCLERAVDEAGSGCVLVAHSLGCLLVARWAARTQLRIRAALLVAVPDPEGPAFPSLAKGFTPVPRQRMPFETHVIASRNDPYANPAFTKQMASDWGAELRDAGEVGHLNADSGLGNWPAAWQHVQHWRDT